MRFRNEILCLVLATVSTPASAFAPSIHSRRSMRMGSRDLEPRDLIASNMKLRQAFALTNTLRWEIQSTLTSDQEAAKTEESSKEGDGDDIPPFPEQLNNGIYEIQNDVQHK